MKAFHGIISIILSIISIVLFVRGNSDADLIVAFIVMLGAIIFTLFMLLEERKQEVEDLRHKLHKILDSRHN
jgi:heme/copper-type cytochrome/quinol oxidase subunit 4